MQFLALRLLHSVFVVLGVAVLTFVMVRVTGDPTVLVLPRDAPQEVRQRFREQMGLDRPLPAQFAAYMAGVVRGDFGTSIGHRRPAGQLVLERMPATGELVAAAIALAVFAGVPLGILAAVRARSGWDGLARGISLIAVAAPPYWIGLMAIFLFAVEWQWVPTSGRGGLQSIILPSATLAMPLLGRLIRLTRAAVLERLHEDYVRTARAKGLAPRGIYLRHVLRNSAIPVVTLLGVYGSYMVAGSVLIESVFAWPGIGLLASQAILERDFPVIQAVAFYAATLVVLITLLTDMFYSLLDPRIRHQ